MTKRKPTNFTPLVPANPRTAVPPATYVRPTPATPAKSSKGGWLVLGAAVVLLFAIGRCSPTQTDTASASDEASSGNVQQAIVAAVQAQSPPPVEALSLKAVGRGLSHIRLAEREGAAGEMIYSQNCYDALGRTFSWSKLDACGAFDAEAALSMEADETAGVGVETAWFQSEAAAGRFLKAATAAGEPSDEADTRWSALQARVSRKHRAPTSTSPATPAAEPIDRPEGEETFGNATV